jgi:hypothetical protein
MIRLILKGLAAACTGGPLPASDLGLVRSYRAWGDSLSTTDSKCKCVTPQVCDEHNHTLILADWEHTYSNSPPIGRHIEWRHDRA